MSSEANTLSNPLVQLDYSLTGVNASLAVEKGLAEAEWYQCPVPRDTMRQLLERHDGPAIRDTILWFVADFRQRLCHLCVVGELVGAACLMCCTACSMRRPQILAGMRADTVLRSGPTG